MSPTSEPSSGPLRQFWRGYVRPFVLAGLLLFAFRSMVVDWNVVPTGSMKPTILEGDYIFVNRLAYGFKVPFTSERLFGWGNPDRGDIVIFTPPGESDNYVKRVVGLPGDRLEMRGNQLFVNEQACGYELLAREDYAELAAGLRRGDALGWEVIGNRGHPIMLSPDRPAPDTFDPITVPEGHYFVMGDNRDDSKDSRYFGFVPSRRIIGRASTVGLSLDPSKRHKPRWSRFFSPLA